MTDKEVGSREQNAQSLKAVALAPVGVADARVPFFNTADCNALLKSIFTVNDKQVYAPTEENVIRVYAKELEQICGTLINLKGQVFHCKGGKKLTYCEAGGKFLKAIGNNKLLRLQDLFPESRLNPLISMVIHAVESYKAFKIEKNYKLFPCPEVLTRTVDVLNQLVEHIRASAACDEFKNVMRNYQRGARKNRIGLHRLVDSIFHRYAKVLVVRVDLYYRQESVFQPANTTYKDVSEDLRRLLKDTKGKLFKKHLITYVWKLEYGLQRGYHYHTYFFFDGSNVMNDVILASKIGEHWVKNVTEGRGSYFNCNSEKDRYSALGIGMIVHRDREKIDHLKTDALEYLMKNDYYIRPMVEEKIRTFGKGALPKSNPTLRGRPRKVSLA